MKDAVLETSEALNARGIRGSLVVYRGSYYWRAVFTDASGKRAQRRVKLDVAANPGQLVTAESRVIELASVTAKTGILPNPLPWEAQVVVSAAEKQKKPKTVAAAVALLEVDFWKGKDRSNSAALRTWQRLELETRRLPQAATINTDLLVAVAESTKANSRTRLEACKVYKRLGVIAGWRGWSASMKSALPTSPRSGIFPARSSWLNMWSVAVPGSGRTSFCVMLLMKLMTMSRATKACNLSEL